MNIKSRTPPVRQGLLLNSFKTSVIGLAMGVAALSVTLAIFTGAEKVIARTIASSVGHVTHFSRWHSKEELENFVKHAPPGVEKAYFFWTTQGLLVGPEGGRGTMIEGRSGTGVPVPPDSPVLVELGKPLADNLGLKEGDDFRILLPGVVRGALPAKLAKTIEYGMYDVDSRLAVVIDESLRPVLAKLDPESLLNRPGDAHGIRFFLNPKGHNEKDIAWVDAWVAAYRKSLAAQGADEKTASFKTWQDFQRNFLGAVGLDKTLLVIVMGLLTLIATLNVAATLVVLFLERDREMAILRAMGLSPRGLLAWIGIQGFLMGAIASVLGFVLARVFGWCIQHLPFANLPADIYKISRIPLSYDWGEQTAALGFGIVAALSIACLLGRKLAQTPLLGILGQRR